MINISELKKEAEIEKYNTFMMLLRAEINRNPNTSVSKIIQKNSMPHHVYQAMKNLKMISDNHSNNNKCIKWITNDTSIASAEKLKIETLRLKANSLLTKIPKHMKHRNLKHIVLTEEMTVVSCLVKLKELYKKDGIFTITELADDIKVEHLFINVVLQHDVLMPSKFILGSYKVSETFSPDLKLAGDIYATYMSKKTENTTTKKKCATKSETNEKYMKFFQWLSDESKGEFVNTPMYKGVDLYHVSKSVPQTCYILGVLEKKLSYWKWCGPNILTLEYTEQIMDIFRNEMNTINKKNVNKFIVNNDENVVNLQNEIIAPNISKKDDTLEKLEKDKIFLLEKIDKIDKAIEAYKTYQNLINSIV